MSTNPNYPYKNPAAAELGRQAQVLLNRAEELETQARRKEAFDRVALIACELQEADGELVDALLELTTSAVFDLRRSWNGTAPNDAPAEWLSAHTEHAIYCFSQVFTLDLPALTQWVVDVAWDEWCDARRDEARVVGGGQAGSG